MDYNYAVITHGGEILMTYNTRGEALTRFLHEKEKNIGCYLVQILADTRND